MMVSHTEVGGSMLNTKYIKKEYIIIQISKAESIALQKLGHKFGSEGVLHHTYTKHKKYYMTESRKALADLKKIRTANIVK